MHKSVSNFKHKRAMKIEVARRIAAQLREQGLTQAEASKAFQVDEGVISRICNANLDIFTLDRLIGIAESMGIVSSVNFEDNR